jgi:triosephosphate isomerase
MSKYLIAGNWKMNLLQNEAIKLIEDINFGISNLNLSAVEVLVCPPYTDLHIANEQLKDSPIQLGAQNMHFMPKGAYTGEISPEMVIDAGCKYVILGHSERRQYFKEDNEILIKKLKSAFDANINPILCIGETLTEREQKETTNVLFNQISILNLFEKENLEKLTIAYEPVWAIGTGVNATKEQIEEVHLWINNFVYSHFGLKVKILYGGSMNATNAKEILSTENVSGGLIGGASLKSEQFLSIIQTAISLSQ